MLPFDYLLIQYVNINLSIQTYTELNYTRHRIRGYHMGQNEDNVELWGQKFSIVKKGLDKSEVAPFVDEIIKERDQLLKHSEHFNSLTKLAERTVAEADGLAEEIKREASEKGREEAEGLISKANEQAKQIVEEKRAEIVSSANEEAKVIISRAKEEVKQLVEDYKEKIQPEIKNITKQLYNQLVNQLDGFRQQTVTARDNFVRRLPEMIKDIGKIPISQDSGGKSPVDLPKKSESTPVMSELPKQEDKNKQAIPEEKLKPGDFIGEVELKILPPINVMQIIGLTQYLDNLPEIETTELIPLHDKPSIIAAINEPMPLLELLKEFPEVAEVNEESNNSTPSKGQRVIQLKFIERKSTIDASKDRLNDEVSDILSKQQNSGTK